MEDRTREETILFSPSSPTTTPSPHLPLPGKKIQSYSQQLTHTGSHNSNRNTLPRKHSLEEDRFLLFGGQEYKTRFAEEEKHAQEQQQQQQQQQQDEQESTLSHTSSYNATTTFHQNSKSRPLPEFIGAGGNDGIFKIPVRAAIPPGRPPSLELRPRPLRDTQTGSFLRVITCSDSQLWAGCESGVRFWNLSDMYMVGGGEVVRTGDVDTTPFFESESTSPVICMTMGMSSKVVWSGHKDGRIRLWNMNQSFDTNGNGTAFVEDLMWRAHRGPVLSLAMSYYGDLWVGCEGGIVKVWPGETIEQSFSLKEDEKDVASLLLERSYLDLRTKVTVNGVCTLSHADVVHLLSDNSKSKVWSAGHHSFALWDARNRELLKVFNIDGHITRLDMPSPRDACVEDENNKTKLSSSSKKEKSQSSLTFLQRSRNALMGAADAVRRVAVKGAFVDDNQRIEAMVLTGDGMVWTGCSSGLLVQWDGNGNRLRDFNHHPFLVRCLCTLGARMWVGYVTGTVQVLDLNGTLLGEWIAHNSPIINMSVGAGYGFTLASHGGIRGWNIVSPGPIDDVLRSEISRRESSYTKLEKLKLLAGTWNVGQGKASHDSLMMWLGSASLDVSIVVVGLQEVEMGAGFLAMSAAKETVGIEGTSIGHWWLEMIGKHLDEGETFELVGSRQLAGLLIALWARKNLRSHIGDVDAAAVPCGFGHAIGNKGGVGLRVRVYDRIMCFVNCHLAAHLEAVNRRNSDFGHIYRTMTFSRPNQANASTGSSSPTADTHQAIGVHSEDRKPELSEADMVIFLGDLNYRLRGISYEEAKDFVSQRCFDWLKERDQLAAEMKAGKVFQGMREGLVTFPPTYKFEKRLGGLGGYDSSEKKRIPAWCDRILYRDNRVASETKCCLDCPIVSSILQYEACMDVTDSDHKPVRCIFSVDIASIDESARRQNFGWIIQSNEKRLNECLSIVPEITVSTNNIIFESRERLILRINNGCKNSEAYFEIICEGQSTIKEDGQGYEYCPRGSFSFPRWLQLTPATGVIKSGKSAEVLVDHEESYTLAEFVDGIPQNWWCEGARDKEVTLTLRVRGSCSAVTESHQICVSHSKHMSKGINSKPKDGSKTRLHHLNSLLEAADTQQSSHTLEMKESCESENQRNISGALQSNSLQEPRLLHQNSSSDAANTKNGFHTSSLDGNIRNGAQNNGDMGSEPMTLFQHLRCFSDAAETKEMLHPPSIESNHKNEDGKQTAGGGQSKTTQGTNLQHQSSPHEDIQPSSHSWLTEEKDNCGARRTKAIGSQSKARQQSNLTSDQAENQQNLHTPPTEGKSRINALNAGEIQPKTVQHADLQHPSVSLNSANTQHGWHSPTTMEVEKNGAERSDTKGITSKSKQQFDVQPKWSFNAAGIQNNFRTPIEEKYRNGARENDVRRIQLKTFQQPDMHLVTSSFNSSRGEENNFREIQPKTRQQLDLQHINPFSYETETQSSLHTLLTEEKGKNGDQENNAIGSQQKILEQPDRGHFNPFSDATDNQHSMHDLAATNGMNKNRDRGNNAKEIQPKTREQPDLHHLNPFADAADYQHSLNNSPTEGTSKTGAQEKIAKGTQPKIPEQPDLQNSNPFSDAADNHHSLRNSPTDGVNKNGAQGNSTKGPERPNLQHSNPFSDATGNQHSSHNSLTNKTSKNRAQGNKDKGVQQPNLQQHCPFSDATDDKYSLPNQSKNEMRNYGAQEVNAKRVQSKILEQPDLLHPNIFFDKADTQHNLHDPSTKRMGKNGVQGNCDRVTDYQSTSLVQLDMKCPSHSGGANTQYRSRCSSAKDKNNERGQEDNANRIRTKSLQQPDLPQQNHSPNTAESQHRLYTPSTEETSKVGDQENTYKGNQPRSLENPDLQYIDCFYDAAGTQHMPHMPLEEERGKSGVQINNPGRTQSKASKQLGSEDMVNGFFDAVDSQHSLNTPSTKEKSKSATQEKDSTTTQSKIHARSDMQHLSHLSDETDIENRSLTQLIEEINKKGGQENFNKDIRTPEQPVIQHPSQFRDAADTEHKLQTPSKEKKSKKDAQEKKGKGTQPKTFQQLDSQPILSSHNTPETQQNMFPALTKKKTKGKSKKETQQDSAKGSHSKSQLDSQHQNPSSDAADSPQCFYTPSINDKSKTKSRKDSAKGIQSIAPQQPDPSQVVRLCDAAATHQKWRAPTVEDKIKTRARKLYLP